MRSPMPYVRMTRKGFSFNAECMQLMPDVGYVQILHSFEHGRLFAIECGEKDEHSIPWRVNCNSSVVRAKNVKWPWLYRRTCKGRRTARRETCAAVRHPKRDGVLVINCCRYVGTQFNLTHADLFRNMDRSALSCSNCSSCHNED